MKEYLALGLPTVSTDFPEVHRYEGLIDIASDAADFVRKVRRPWIPTTSHLMSYPSAGGSAEAPSQVTRGTPARRLWLMSSTKITQSSPTAWFYDIHSLRVTSQGGRCRAVATERYER